MSDGSEFQVRGDATENARRARSLRVLGTVSSGASETWAPIALITIVSLFDS